MPQIFPEKSPRFILVLLVAILAIFLDFTLGSLSPNKANPKLQNQSSPTNQVSGVRTIPESTQSVNNREKVKVTRVVDGDTIEISAIGGPTSGGEGGQKVRYIGIDTPETVDPRKPVQCFGQEAAAKNRQLVEGKVIQLEKDISETDKYGRLLRYIYIDDLFVNDYLVRQGYDNASSYPPDIKYQDQFQQAEQEAQENDRGLWGQCVKGQQTSVSSQSVSDSDSGCKIKGNISSTGEKIYHLPGQYYWEKTVIDTTKGERWFCTEEEAITAGWRKSKK